MAVWKGHSFNTISGREAEKFSGKDSGKGDSDFNDSDSDISGDALKKDLINHMQSGEATAPQPRPAVHLSFPTASLLETTVPSPSPSSLSSKFQPQPVRCDASHGRRVFCLLWLVIVAVFLPASELCFALYKVIFMKSMCL